MKPHTELIRDLFRRLFDGFMEDLDRQRRDSVIFKGFLNGMSAGYLERQRPAEVVRDFIAGMTDRYFLDLCPEALRPGYVPVPEGDG
jgi:dGTPase